MSDNKETDGYIIEMIPMGRFIKVTAVCPKTYVEGSIVGDPTMPEKLLADRAIKKLQYILSKANKGKQ